MFNKTITFNNFHNVQLSTVSKDVKDIVPEVAKQISKDVQADQNYHEPQSTLNVKHYNKSQTNRTFK